ncbi:MAG: hypothetical protein BWK80_60710 [Desulfobacteraceae bacterium IS3]|nr:MAG: hypothetical protein BWK80_60710 [Desulfobacteraceae bacterium IS3]
MNPLSKILIVDDKPENLYALESVLKAVDAEIIKAGNGNEALIATLNHDFALAVLDIQMPEMDGYELAELMQGDEQTRSIPIIFLSAVFSDDVHKFRGYESGAVDFITKPFDPDILLSKVKIFLELNRRKTEAEEHKNKLRSSNALMTSIMESPKNIAIFALDREYRYINFNQSHKKTVSRTWNKEIDIGMNILDMIKDPEKRNKAKDYFDRALKGETFISVEEFESESSEQFYTENHYNPITTEDRAIIGLTVFLTDITKRRQIEEDLKHTNDRLREHIDERGKIEAALLMSKEKAERERETAETANKKLTDSIRYAQMIQSSLLPNPENIKGFLSDSFFIWKPRDIVGGDFIFTDWFDDGLLIAVIDCTGHGVPGAFMTIIASFGLKKITGGEGFHTPDQILKRMNFLVKTTLQQDTEYALSDDGLDAAICFIKPEEKTLTFAGARLPLFYVSEGEVKVIKGDRQSVGYKRSDVNFKFSSHTINIEPGMVFYMLTDGFIDQVGGKNSLRFGTKKLTELLKANSKQPFDKQRDILIKAYNEHRGENEIRDDVTVIGFGFK